MEVSIKIGGRFWWEVKSPRGDRRGPEAGTGNLITDVALDEIFPSSVGQLRYLHVGEGASAFSNSSTRLTNRVASVGIHEGSWSNGTEELGYAFAKHGEWRFPVGAVVGNIGELGLSHLSGEADMSTLALVRDESGAPTAITLLEDEQLIVTYSVEFYADTSVRESTIQFTGDVGSTLPPHTIKVCPMQLWTTSSNYGWYTNALQFSSTSVNVMTNSGSNTTSASYGGYDTTVRTENEFGDLRNTATSGASMFGKAADAGSISFSRVAGQRKYLHRWSIPPNWEHSGKPFNMLYWKMGFGKFQIFIDPPITVAPENKMTLDMHFSWDRHEDED